MRNEKKQEFERLEREEMKKKGKGDQAKGISKNVKKRKLLNRPLALINMYKTKTKIQNAVSREQSKTLYLFLLFLLGNWIAPLDFLRY